MPHAIRPVVGGVVAICCGVLGVSAWVGYARAVSGAIKATAFHDRISAKRLLVYAGAASVAQIALGIAAISLGTLVCVQRGNSSLAKRLGAVRMASGAFVLFLLLLLV